MPVASLPHHGRRLGSLRWPPLAQSTWVLRLVTLSSLVQLVSALSIKFPKKVKDVELDIVGLLAVIGKQSQTIVREMTFRL